MTDQWIRQRWSNLCTGDFARVINFDIVDGGGRLIFRVNAQHYAEIGRQIRSGSLGWRRVPEYCGGGAFDGRHHIEVSTPLVNSNITRIVIIHEAVHVMGTHYGYGASIAVEEAAAYLAEATYRRVSSRREEPYVDPPGVACIDEDPRLQLAARRGHCDYFVPILPVADRIARSKGIGLRHHVTITLSELAPLTRLISRDCTYNDGGRRNPMTRSYN